jgi:hypothetical protein
MRPWPLVAALTVVLAQAPAPAEPTAEQPLIPAAPLSQSKFVQEHVSLACGTAPPATVAKWRRLADAIVHVRVDSQVTYDHEIPTLHSSQVMTAHEVTVLDAFKGDQRAGVAGASMTILQEGGDILRADGIHRYRTNKLDILPVGSEWVLFLYWNSYLEGFGIWGYEDGAFQMMQHTVNTLGHGPFADSWRGQPASAFLEALEPPR